MIKETIDLKIINGFLNHFQISINSIGVYSKYLVYYLDENPIAFLNYDLIYDRVEIEYIFVNIENRRKNIASTLIKYLFNIVEKENCKNITLEVRESNVNAIGFYNSVGFKEVSKRENYYENENAILMMKEMC